MILEGKTGMVEIRDILKIAKRVNPAVREGMELISGGVLNSIEIVALVIELESEYGIQISPLDIDEDHFNTLDSIADLVDFYKNSGGAAGAQMASLNIDVNSYKENLNSGESAGQSSETVNIKVEKSFGNLVADQGASEEDAAFIFPKDAKTVLDFLENAAAQVPDKTAFIDQYGNRLTYQEVLQLSKAVGTYVQEKYECTGEPFLVLERRNVRDIVMMLGIMWSGNYYIALDESLSFENLESMLELTGQKGVLWHYNAQNFDIFDLDLDINIYDEMVETEADEELLQKIKTGFDYDSLMFGVFTSGTTGSPKCVVKSHGAMVEFISRFADMFEFRHSEVFASKLAFMFDAVTKDIYTTLYCAAQMYIMPIGNTLPTDDAAFMEAAGVTAAIWTPPMLRSFAALHILEQYSLPSLRKVFFVGEPLQGRFLNQWLQAKPETLYVNLYGTTEMTGNCLYKIVNRPVETEVVTLDQVFSGYQVQILDENDQAVTEAGKTGEICVSGSMLMKKEIGETESTENLKVYRTGDIVRIEEDGSYQYLTRKDNYFKHNGYRLSPGEVESQFAKLDYVDLTACVYDAENDKIVLFWQGDAAKEEELYSYANEKLPPYMKPGIYHHVGKIPVNTNGKIDRKQLMDII